MKTKIKIKIKKIKLRVPLSIRPPKIEKSKNCYIRKTKHKKKVVV